MVERQCLIGSNLLRYGVGHAALYTECGDDHASVHKVGDIIGAIVHHRLLGMQKLVHILIALESLGIIVIEIVIVGLRPVLSCARHTVFYQHIAHGIACLAAVEAESDLGIGADLRFRRIRPLGSQLHCRLDRHPHQTLHIMAYGAYLRISFRGAKIRVYIIERTLQRGFRKG